MKTNKGRRLGDFDGFYVLRPARLKLTAFLDALNWPYEVQASDWAPFRKMVDVKPEYIRSAAHYLTTTGLPFLLRRGKTS